MIETSFVVFLSKGQDKYDIFQINYTNISNIFRGYLQMKSKFWIGQFWDRDGVGEVAGV